MTLLEVRKLRLDRMISLARVYRNWTSGQMKGALGVLLPPFNSWR
jgi:hypothetical protein